MRNARGKLFQNGGSQAVRLPKECRFTTQGQGEVLVRREGRRVILEAADEWPDKFRACLGAWAGKIPRPKQQRVRDLRDPFA
jgi:virulence-associated protein VagC